MFSQVLYAQDGAAAAMGGLPPQFLMMGAIFAIFYFLMIRPQQKERKRLQEAVAALKKGDKVITAGGIFAEYVSDKENGIAVIKIAENTKIEINKSAITTVVVDKPVKEDKKDKKDKKGKKEDKNAIKEELEKIEEKDNK